MKHPLLLLLLLAAPCMAASTTGVDALSPADVSKAMDALKKTYASPISATELERDTLQGALDRMAPQVALLSGTDAAPAGCPFYSEDFNGTGYLRPGLLNAEAAARTAGVLKDWSGKSVAAVVLDLRGTPPGSDFDAALALEQEFSPKGAPLFTLSQTSSGAVTGAPPASGQPGLFTGILVVLVDESTAEAAEAVAASLQAGEKAMIVGATTAGRGFEYEDVPLNGAVLRMAVAEVVLPNGAKLGAAGLKPDIAVAAGPVPESRLMESITASGVDSVIEEHDRPHLNEAALVSGSNPDVDELEAEQAGRLSVPPMIDRQLQQALDVVTSISIYQAKDRGGSGGAANAAP